MHFENINLSTGSLSEKIKRFRQNLAEQLEELIKEGEVKPEDSIESCIKKLKESK